MTAPEMTVAMPSPWKMYRALVGIGLCCGLLIVSVYQFTAPIILANQIAAREKAVLQVLPGAVESRTFAMSEDGVASPAAADSESNWLVFAGFDGAGALVGLAVEASGMGYQDKVRILYGFAPDRQAVIGFKVLESKETPGLGDRVETDPQYQANFEALDVSLDESGEALAHLIEPVKPGQKTDPWQIDTISGATITSKAVAVMLSGSTEWWIPKLVKNLDRFTAPPSTTVEEGATAEESR